MTRSRLSLAAAALAALTVLTAACGSGSAEADAARAKKVEAIPADQVPDQLLGLKLAPEADILETVKANTDTYVEAVGLFSLRRGELLQATLQVSRFTAASDADRASFRRSVIGQVGSTDPQQFRMGDQNVWLTTGKNQRLFVWFKQNTMFILTTRADYETPRTLLREAIEELKP